MSGGEQDRKRAVFREHVWQKNADPSARNYGWSDEEIDALLADLESE